MKTTRKIALIALFTAFALSACGNKGPLILPDEEATETIADDAGEVDADIDDENTSDAADTSEDDTPPADTDPPGDGNG